MPFKKRLLNFQMACEEKRRLGEAYQQITAIYAAAVTQLHRKMSISSKAEYDSLYRMTKGLHAAVTRAQGELKSHVVVHHC
jgi:hypothetical protein